MIGILLAGGKATRLPNKPLLPMRDLRPVCFSGMDYLLRHGVEYVSVVVPPNSVLVDIISRFYGHEVWIEFVYQAEPTGVGDALNLVSPLPKKERLVVMADNIYPDETLALTNFTSGGFVTVREVPAWRLPHLVKIDHQGHLSREGPGGAPGGATTRRGIYHESNGSGWALSTPWYVPNDYFFMVGDETWKGLELFRRMPLSGPGWWDVGSPDVYAAYWRGEA